MQDVNSKLWKLCTWLTSRPTQQQDHCDGFHSTCALSSLITSSVDICNPGCRRYQRYHCCAPALTIACHLVRRHRVPESLGNLGDIATWYDALPSWGPSSPPQDAIHGAPYKVSLLQGQNSFVIFGSKKIGYNFTFKRILNALIFLFLSCGHEKLFFSSLERLTSWMHERLATADYRTLFSKSSPCYPAMAKVNASAQNLLSKYHVVQRSNSQVCSEKPTSKCRNIQLQGDSFNLPPLVPYQNDRW